MITLADGGFGNGSIPLENVNPLTEAGVTSRLIPDAIDEGPYHAIAYTTDLTISEAGDYAFGIRFTDGARLFVDGVAVAGHGGGGSPIGGLDPVPVSLTQGGHRLDVIFIQNTGGQALSLSMSGPDTGGATIDLAGYEGLSAPGAAGADVLDGGAGDNTLWGGAGADVFVLSEGHDVVGDFDFDVDEVDFGGATFDLGGDGANVEAIFVDGSDAVRLHLGEGQSLTFLGFDRTTFLAEGTVAWTEV